MDQLEESIPKFSGDFSAKEQNNNDVAHKLFDVNSYFNILNHLKVVDGYSLDYVYCYFDRYGSPLILSQKNGEPPHAVHTACKLFDKVLWFPEAKEKMSKDYLNVIVLDGTPQSFFQFSILYLLGDQFFLFDHALYDDDIIICNRDRMIEVLDFTLFMGEKLPDDVKMEAKKIDVAPSIVVDDYYVTVKIITFSQWGGFQRQIFRFVNANGYYYLSKKETETLVKYNIGITF